MPQGAPGGPFPRPLGTNEVDVERSIMVSMRDGVRLSTDVYRPRNVAGPLPTILIRLPYNKATYRGATVPAEYFASHGYAVAVQDVRGKFASEGEYHVYQGDMTDWSDTFDWIGTQSWSTGRIGTYGCSYLGEGQIVAAQQRHPKHIAAIAQAAGGNIGRVGRRREFWGSVEGGAFAMSINFGWMPVFASTDKGARPAPNVELPAFFKTLPVIDMTERAGSPSWDWRNFLERSPDDPWWDKQGYLSPTDSVTVAALHVSSWFDMAEEALEEAELFRKNALNDRAKTGQYAIISPTVHCASEGARSQTKVGDLDVGDARLHYWETYLAWFDHWLRGNEHAIDSLPRIQYYVIGRNEWRTSDRWPIAAMRETPFFLRSDGGANTSKGDGRLSLTTPTRDRPDTFTYDPADPVPARGGSICCTGNPKDVPGSFDQSDNEQRPDVLVYTTDVLRDGLELTGPMRAEVFLSSDAPDTDITVKLTDVFPDGRSMNMQEGITRVRYRDGFSAPRMMSPGKVYKIPVDLHATSWYLQPGHRLRVQISSSNFPRFDRNLNTGGRNYDETTWRRAKNTIHHTSAYASRLILPVVQSARPSAPGTAQNLFNGKDLSGWHVDVPADSNVRVRNPFIVRNGMLVSRGEPQGHLITDAIYRDYRLEVQYRFPGTPGNAGVLVHASTPRALYKMFPRSIEVQMEHGNAGDFWCIVEDIRVPDMERRRGPPAEWGTTEGKARRILNLTDSSEKPLGKWNTMVIAAVGRSIKVWVNGDLVNEGTDATADRGQIAIQSEGSEVEFRKVSLTAIQRVR